MLRTFTSEWLRDRFEDGGPTYIKLGQFIANRRDIFGKELSTSMVKLQDRVKPVSWTAISKNINYEPFLYIDEIPIATASVAQVHKGLLKNGKNVAIKIKKPGVDKTLRRDMNILSTLFKNDFINEFKLSIEKELDFSSEIENIRIFENIYEYSDNVIIPHVYKDLCTDTMIVMDYVPSEKVSSNAKELVTFFINQLLYEDYIHGDLHSGNIGKTGDSIILYDFGNIIKTSKRYRTLMRDFVYYMQMKNTEKLLETMEKIGMVIVNKEVTQNFITKFLQYIDTLDINSFKFDPDEIQEKVPVKLDKTTASILRSYSLLEGYCKRIDPDFNYNEILMSTLEVLYLDIDYIMYRMRRDIDSIL